MSENNEFPNADDYEVRKLVNLLILMMLKNEHDEFSIKPRDGKLQVLADFDELEPLDSDLLTGLVDRLKFMADLDTEIEDSEQSGQMELSIIDFGAVCCRVTTVPSEIGEGVVVSIER